MPDATATCHIVNPPPVGRARECLQEFRQVLRHADDLEKIKELYSIEQLEEIVGRAERSVNEMEEFLRRMTTFEELGREINDEGSRFLEDFKRNIQVAEESRVVFVQTVRNAIAIPPVRND